MLKKILCVLLAMLMLLPLATGCTPPSDMPPDQTPDEKEESQPTPTAPALTLAKDGVSEYVIVRGKDAYISEVTAATELQKYFKQICGAELPIVTDDTAPAEKEIVVGKTNRENDGEFDRDKLGEDGLVIKTRDEKLFLVGGEQRGTLYAVYEFLESYLGCRFYTSSFEKIPQSATITINSIKKNEQIPVFTIRNTFWYDYTVNSAFSAKRKCNGRKFTPLDEEYGGSARWAGSAGHTFSNLLGKPTNSPQPCLTNEDIFEQMLDAVFQRLEENPGATLISVSQNDNNQYCRCKNCAALEKEHGSYAGVVLNFVNRIAEEVAAYYPGVMVHTFAYFETSYVPTGIEPADNVMVELCSIQECFRHPLEDCEDCHTNPSGKLFSDLIVGWSEICDTLAIWDYTTNFMHYSLSHPNFEVLLDNAAFFADHNVKYIFEQGTHCGPGAEFDELRGYLISKILWDPYMSYSELDALMVEFINDYYGPGGEYIYEYIQVMQDESAANCVGIYDSPYTVYEWPSVRDYRVATALPDGIIPDDLRDYESVDWVPYINWYRGYDEPTILSEGERLFALAMEKAETEEQKAHLDLAYIQIMYLRSFYLSRQMQQAEPMVKSMMQALSKEYPGEFTTTEQNKLQAALIKEVKQQASEYYASYNLTLAEAAMNAGIRLREFQAITDTSRLKLTNLPNDWY